MSLRAVRVALLVAFASVSLAPVASAALEIGGAPVSPAVGADQGSQGQGGVNGNDPTAPISNCIDASAYVNQNCLGNGDGGGLVNPPGDGDGGLKEIAPSVAQTLSENLLYTSIAVAALGGLAVAGWFLSSRYIDPKVALRSPERSMLYGFVKGNPGVHLKQLSTEFKMKTSTVLWHVRKLEAADLIRSKKANGYRVFYPVSGGLEASRVSEAVTALSNGNARGIFAFIVEHPGAPLRALVESLMINPGTVRWHLKKLHKAGLLEETPGEVVRATDLGMKAWTQIQGAPTAVSVPVVPMADATSTTQPQEVLSQ